MLLFFKGLKGEPRNIPGRVRAQKVLSAVRALGFTEDDLVYLHLPVKQGRTFFNLGYCFIGFCSVALARQFLCHSWVTCYTFVRVLKPNKEPKLIFSYSPNHELGSGRSPRTSRFRVAQA